MNMLQLVMLVITNNVEELAGWGRERLTHALRLLYASVLLPLALLFVGIAAGWIGYRSDVPGLVSVAEACIIVSGFTAALLLALFWVKTAVLTHIVSGASQIASVAVKGVSFNKAEIPAVNRESAELFIQWMRGVTGWLTVVCLWGMVVPIWRNVGMSLIVATCFLFLSAAMTARWVDGGKVRKVVIWLVVILLVVASFVLVAPRAARNVGSGINGVLDQASFWNDNRQKMAGVEREAAASQKKLDLDLVKKLRARQHELQQRAVYRCGGNFCTSDDKAEYAQLDTRIASIQQGTHWKVVPKHQNKPTVVKAVPVSPQPRKHVRTPQRVRPKKTKAQIDYVYEGLDRFDDID